MLNLYIIICDYVYRIVSQCSQLPSWHSVGLNNVTFFGDSLCERGESIFIFLKVPINLHCFWKMKLSNLSLSFIMAFTIAMFLSSLSVAAFNYHCAKIACQIKYSFFDCCNKLFGHDKKYNCLARQGQIYFETYQVAFYNNAPTSSIRILVKSLVLNYETLWSSMYQLSKYGIE